MSSALDESLSLSKLLDAEGFTEVCRSFGELFGIGLRVFDLDGSRLVDIRATTGDHCGYLFTVHPTKVMCTNLVNDIRTCEIGKDPNAPREVDCFSGLRYKIIPLMYEGSALGRLILGPYKPDTISGPPATLAEYRGDGLDLDKLTAFLAVVPPAHGAAVDKVLGTVRKVLDAITHTSYKSYLTSQMHIASISGAFSDLESVNNELRDANQRLTELDRLKSNFIATVSHELRTPLTSVIGYSEMLLEGMAGELTDEQNAYIRTILEKGESLLNLIGQVLDLSRIESGNVLLNRVEMDPRNCVETSLSDIVPQARKRNLTVNVDIGEDVKPIIADQGKIRQVLTNLLGNAVKFTSPGGEISVSVEITDSPNGIKEFDIFQPERNRYLQIEVADTGVGIPQDKVDRVFDSFFQVDNTSTREFGGSGLGLSIALNFIHAHGGKITVDSEVGRGSTFTILLPYHPENPAAESPEKSQTYGGR